MVAPGGETFDTELDAQVENIFGLFLTGHVVLDTMVPLYFELHGIADKFRGIFKDRSHLPGAVYRELDGITRARGSARTLLQLPRWFRIHEISDDAMAERVLDRQRRWRGKAEVENDPLPDRGEAECLEICLDLGYPLLSHDHHAISDGARDDIAVGTTIDVLAIMVVRGMFRADQAWMIYTRFISARLYPVRDYPDSAMGEARFKDLVARCQARQRGSAAATSPTSPPATS